MNKKFSIFILLMAIFVPWAAKAQETKIIQSMPDRGGDRTTMTVYKRVTSLTSGSNYLIVSSATANSDALAMSQVSSTASNITASYVHINAGISGTNNAVYIADLADATAVWKATSGWTFSHSTNGSTYYIYAENEGWIIPNYTLSANTSSTNWTYSNNSLYYSTGGWFSTNYYITPSSSGFSIGSNAANVYLFEETEITAYNITAEVSPDGIGRVTGAGQYPAGATCTLTASTFNSEYTFSNWTVNGSVVSTDPTYSFTVSADQNVVANFESTVSCPSPSNLTAGTIYGHSVLLDWTGEADNFNVRYRTIGSGETQTFFDGFEDGLGNWTVIRNGGGTDATDWLQGPDRENLYAHTGSYVAESRSWNNTAYSVDNWLITPQVTLDGTLKFWVYGNGSYPDHYDVYVSTTGNSISDFSLFYEPASVTSTWTEVTVDLSSFNGVRGYIALRHTDTDKEYLMIDDFGIYAERYGEWSQLIPANSTSFTLTGLESQTQYQVQVQANCGDELSGWSNRVNFTTPAPSTAAPTDLMVDVNSIRSNMATVSWQGVAANDSHQYYEVYYAESDVTLVPDSIAAPNFIDSIAETSYTISGLTPETEYHVWVRDYCGEDGYSAWTPYQTFTTLESCLRPTNVTVSDITAHNATVAWEDDSDDHQYYQVYYAESDVTSVPDSIAAPYLIDSISETAYTLTGLSSETEYHVWVRDFCGDDYYSAWSLYQTFTTLVSCPAPTGLAVIENSITGHDAIVSWDSIATQETGPVIFNYVCVASGDTLNWDNASTIIDDVDSPNPPTVNLTDLEPETEYTFYLRKDCNEEGISREVMVSFTTEIACPAPTELTVVEDSLTSHTATISWTDSSYGYQYYQLYYAESNDTLVPDTLLAAPNLIDSISATSYILTRLHSDTEYHVWVRAYCGDSDGYSDWTSYQTFTTLVSCPAPTGLAVIENSITGHDAIISWDSIAMQETELAIFNYVCVASGDTLNWDNAITIINDVDSPNPPTVNLTDLEPETEYTFYLRKDCDEEGYSREVMVSFTTEIACPTPTDLIVVEDSITGHEATVNWTNASYGHQYYQLYYAESIVTSVPDSLAAPNLIDSIPVTSYTLSGLHSDTEYHVWVRAYCGDNDGYSDWTSYQTFTTLVSCFQPTDVTITDETGHGATIEWNGTSESYLVMVSEAEQGITYSYDFEDGTLQGWTTLQGPNSTSPHNWMHISEYSYAYNYATMSSGHGYNGSDGYVYSESYITASSGGTGSAVTPDNYLVSPQVRLGGSITFHAGGQNVEYCAEKFSLMVSTTGNDDINNFTTVQTWTFTPTASSGNEWQEFTVDLSAYSGMGYVAIHHFDCYDQWFLCIDDITIENGPEDPSWITYEAEESPFVLYDAENIHPETTYNVQVIGVCGDEESRPSATTSFTTLITCPAPTDLAVVENSVTGHGATLTWNGSSESYIVNYRPAADFNAVLEEHFTNLTSGIPANWDNSEGTTTNDSYKWTYYNTGHEGAGLRFNSYFNSSGNTNFLKTPAMNFPAGKTMKLSFWWKNPDGGDFSVYVSTDGGSTKTAIAEGLTSQSDWKQETIILTNYVGASNVTFHFKGTSNWNLLSGDPYIYLDDVVIGYEINAGEWQTVTAEEIPFTLTGLAPETLYEVVVQSDCGEEGLSAESEPVTFTTVISCPVPTPLDATEVTPNSVVLNWTGDAESYNVSYYKTFFFDSFEEDLSQWTVYKNGDDASFEWGIENPHDNSSDLNAHSGDYAVVAYSADEVHADNWLVSPQILFPNQTMLKFWIMRSTYDDAQDEYEVLLSTTGNDVSDFTTVLKEKAAANSAWTEVEIDLSEYDGQQGYIAIRHDFTGGFFLMVDDFGIYGWSEPIATTDNSLLIEDLLPETEYTWRVQANCGEEDGLSQWTSGRFTTLPSCPVPFDLTATDETAYGATIAWTGFNESYNVWVGQYEMSTTSYDFEDQSISADFTNDATYPWEVTNASSNNGSYSLKSGNNNIANSTSSIQITVDFVGNGTISFAARCSSEQSNQSYDWDYGTFYIDDVQQGDKFINSTTFASRSYEVEAGTHTFMWRYKKDGSINSNDDCFYVDDITIESEALLSEMSYTATESPFILNDESYILPETTYFVKVKGSCGDGETEYSEAITFTTLDENTKIFISEGDWSDGDNWMPAGVPSMEQDVILRAEATVFDIAEANTITIEGTATLTIEDGGQLKTNADVVATMKKFIIGYGIDYVETNNGYYLMTLPTVAPIAAADAGLITEESDYDLYSWDRTATDEEWQNNHDSINLQNGMGFLYANRDDMEMNFTATLRNSSEPVVVTPAYDEVEHGGWNLCGNPFPCEAYFTTNAEGMTFYRLVDNELVPIEGAIAPLEAFFVNATAAGQTFTISREAPEER